MTDAVSLPAPAMRKGAAVGWLAVAVLLAVFPTIADALGQPALVPLVGRILIYGMAAATLNLVLGYGGLVSFGHAAYFGLGGYVAGVMALSARNGDLAFGLFPGTDQLLVALAVAAVMGAVLAAVIGSLSLRTSGVQFIMITLAFAQMVYFLFLSLKAYGGDDGLPMRRRLGIGALDMRDDRVLYFVALTGAVIVFLVIWRITVSRFGRVLSGLRQNEARMQAIGIAPRRYRLVAFILAGAGASMAGVLMANQLRFVSPDMLHWTKSGELMIMVILGGVGTLAGPFLGAAALVGLETVLGAFTERWQLLLGPILLAVVLYTHGGIAGLVTKLVKGRAP
ncbi:branched-chain amino acid ABC transporter permease [uncultured Alsobacter sp.]|uniref:branched-chain amino acid ABC transporter permease n=1 Tax=uncultured Alsobacter sp. TaxID=1748258 RepID=UPI0025CFFD24|nr:branched-chain amino acid ABC transporter permease [uncultured Alsobacter sp.]